MGLGQAEKGQHEQQQGSGRHRCAHNVGMTRWDGLRPQGTARTVWAYPAGSEESYEGQRGVRRHQGNTSQHSLTKNVLTLI